MALLLASEWSQDCWVRASLVGIADVTETSLLVEYGPLTRTRARALAIVAVGSACCRRWVCVRACVHAFVHACVCLRTCGMCVPCVGGCARACVYVRRHGRGCDRLLAELPLPSPGADVALTLTLRRVCRQLTRGAALEYPSSTPRVPYEYPVSTP